MIKVKLVQPDLQDLKAKLVLKVNKVFREFKVYKVILVQQDQLVQLVLKVKLDQ